MGSDLGLRIGTSLQPIYDIVLRPTPTVQVAGAADLAPAGGLDIAVIGGIALVVAVVLALIVHRRRKK